MQKITQSSFSPSIPQFEYHSQPINIDVYFRPGTYMVVVLPAPLCPRNEVICPS